MAKTIAELLGNNNTSANITVKKGKTIAELLEQSKKTQTTIPQVEERDHNTGGFLGGVGYTLGKFGTGVFSILEGIWDYTAGGIADLFGADDWAEEQFANNITAQWNQGLDEWYNPDDTMKVVGDVSSGLGNSLVGLAAVAGASALAVFSGGALAPAAASAIAGGVMGLGAAGMATSEAYAKTGELGGKEYLYGALTGVTEGALEGLTGVAGKVGAKIFAKETAKTVAKSSVVKGILKDIGSSFAGEAFEEGLSEILTPVYQRITQVDPNAQNATPQQVIYAAMVGGISGALMGGIGTGISTAKSISRGNEISKNAELTKAVVATSEKFARYAEENASDNASFQYVQDLVNTYKANGNGTGVLTIMQKKVLGEMERANAVLTVLPEVEKSKAKIRNDADRFAEYINSRNITDADTGKPFHFANGAELIANDGLVTQFAVADALGQLMLTPDSVYSIVSSKRADGIMQSDFRNFQKNATAEYKKAINKLYGIDVDSITYEDFIETIKKTDRNQFDSVQGGMAARASAKKAISKAQNTGADISAFDRGANIVKGTSIYKSADGKVFAVTKAGSGYYLYNGKDISKKLTKAQLLEVIDALNGIAPVTNQATETIAKKGQKTAEKPTAQTSPTGTQTAQETEKSKPKTAPKKKATIKKKTAAVKPATEQAKSTDKATQKREAIAKMRKSEDATERVLAELFDNGAADYDAVTAMKDGQDLSTVDKVAFFATGTAKDYVRQGLYTEKSLATAIKEYADDIRAGKDVLVQVMDRAIELDGKQQPNWYKEQYHKAAEPTQTTKTATPKKVKARSLSKARENLLKFVLRKDNERTPLRGAFMINGKQYLSDGYFAVAYDDVMEGLTQAKGEPMTILEKIIEAHRTTDAARSVNVDMDAIRENYPPRGAESMEYLAKLGDSYFQTQLVRKVGETLKNPVFYVVNKMQKGINAPFTESMLYIKADNGEAVILPIRPDKKGNLPSEVVRYTADFAKAGTTETTTAQTGTATPKKKTTTQKTTPKAKATETTTAKPVKEKTIHGKTYKDFTVEEFNALSAPFRGYYLAKSKKPNAIVFAQLGDFYEAFFDDAKTVANEFELTLTGRAVNGYTDRVEMVGFPVRFFDDYKAKLNAKGLDVVKVDLDGKKVLYTAKTGAESTQYAISETATQETQPAGGKSQNLSPLQMKRAETYARTHVKGYENLTAAEKLEVEWTIASGWRYGASESDILSLAKISALSGVGIGFADLKATTSDGNAVDADAACYSRSGHLTIYLNPESKRTVEVATLHELTHALEGTEGYAELQKKAEEYYAKHPEEKAAIDKMYRDLYKNEQVRYADEILPSELTAHYIEKMLEKRNVLAQMTAENPTFMQRCINWLKTRVSALRGVDTQAADEVDMLARKFVSTFNLNKNKIGTTQQLDKNDKIRYAFKGKRVASYINHKLDTPTLSYIRNELYKIYDGVESGIADSVGVVKDDTIYILDSGKENGQIDFGVRKKLKIVGDTTRQKRLEAINEKARRDGHISRGLLGRFGGTPDNSSGGGVGRLLGNELSTNKAKSQNNQSGISTENATGGGKGLKKYALTVTDSDGKALSAVQQDYFKDSKAVDKNGNLQVVYHGTEGEFYTFDKALRGSVTGTKDAKLGFFFTSSKSVAHDYAVEAHDNKYLNLMHKIANGDRAVISQLSKLGGYKELAVTEDIKEFGSLQDKGERFEHDIMELYLNIENPLVEDWNGKPYKKGRMLKLITRALQGDYDGVIIRNIDDTLSQTGEDISDVFVAFEPEQIKLTTNKSPSKNTDIRYALKGADKVMTKLPDDKVTLKDVLLDKATKEQLTTQVKGVLSEQSEAVKVLMTNAQAALERVLTENGIADATARTNYIRAGKYAAHNAIETQGGQYSLDGETRVGDSLGKIMQPIYKANEKDGKTYADFELYLLHHHNVDRMAVGKPVFGDDVTAVDSQAAIAELDKGYPQFRKIAEKIWKFNDNNLQLSVDSGMYSQEYADTLREMYPHYVPTFREEYATRAAALMGKNNVWVNNAKKAAKGSSARILPIDDMIAAQTIQKTTSARINSLLVEMLERGDHDEFKVIATEDAEIQIDDDTQVTTYEDKTKNTHQVTFYHNGKKVTAQVSRLVFKGVEAFRASSDMSDNVALNAVAKINSTFKKLVTSLNPFFSFFKNPIRDMQDALLYTRYSHREYLKNYNRARQEIAHNGHYWQEAKAAGITAASVYDYQKGIEYKQNGVGARVKRFWGKLESASNAIEMAPRMAEYICAREAGLTVQEALLQAQDVTTNFGRGGTFAKKLNSTVMPFLNPAIQGFSKMWRSYTGENGKKAWVNLIIRSLILGIGATALNDLLNGDDEEYENLSDYVKEQNYVIVLGGGDFLKIPKGRVIGVFGNAFLRGKRYAQGETDAWEGYFDSVMSSVTPVENFTRTIFSPITDAQTNTTWYGGAIESQKWNDTEPKNRYDESTSKIAIWLGSVFNYSPLKIDYLLEQYTGIVGDLVLPATSTQAESGIITQNMLVNSTTNSKWSTKFYSTLEDYTYKKTAGDLQAKGVVRYLTRVNSTISDMYNQKRTIQADKTLSNDEKLTQTKIIQAAINTFMQEAVGNAEYIYGELGKYNLSDEDDFDQAYLDCISVVMGEEYALQTYNKDVYAKATKLNTLGIEYDDYYDIYFDLNEIKANTEGSAKKATVIKYIMSQDLPTKQKIILILSQGYSIADGDIKGVSSKTAKTAIAKYITNLNVSKDEKAEIAKMLGFTVENGRIYLNK